ncbi:MAG: hypothetical protein AB7G13_00755 [Lautropia sp.]
MPGSAAPGAILPGAVLPGAVLPGAVLPDATLLRAALLGAALLGAWPTLASAQASPPTAADPSAAVSRTIRPDPLDAAALVPRLEYRTALPPAGRIDDLPVGDWRAANDTVGRIGGWRAYQREIARDADGSHDHGAPAQRGTR